MKRKMTFLGHEVVHDCEDTFFHFSSILSSQNDHLSLVEVKRDSSIVDDIRDELVGTELTSIEDVIVSSISEIFLELLGSGSDKHVSHEESVI